MIGRLPSASHGKLVVGCAALFVLALAVFTIGYHGAHAESLRLFIRIGARMSFVLFLLIFTGSSLHALVANAGTRWLLAHRRHLGFALAVVHFSVGAVLVAFATGYRGEFYEVTYPLQRIGGAFGYLALAVLVVTSWQRIRRRITPELWLRIHTVGIWFLFINFTVSYLRRAVIAGDAFFTPFVAALVMAALLRWIARPLRSATR